MLTTCVIIYHYRFTTYLFSIHTEASTHIENIIVYIFYPSAISIRTIYVENITVYIFYLTAI